jgi:hypothetical protein
MIRRHGKLGNFHWVFCVLVVLLLFPLSTASAGGFRFRLLLSYVDGVQDLADIYEDDIEASYSYVDVDTTVWPVGISLFPYYQWDNGLMLGAGIGPFIYLWADGWDKDYTHWQLPTSFNVGYAFGPDNPISFYVRGGPSYHFAGGDFYDSSELGFVGAIGCQLVKANHFAMGLEASYDSAEVNIDDLKRGSEKTRGIKTAEYSLGLFFQFM